MYISVFYSIDFSFTIPRWIFKTGNANDLLIKRNLLLDMCVCDGWMYRNQDDVKSINFLLTRFEYTALISVSIYAFGCRRAYIF